MIAPVPCPSCVDKLERAFKAGKGKPALAELDNETTILRNEFTWAAPDEAVTGGGLRRETAESQPVDVCQATFRRVWSPMGP